MLDRLRIGFQKILGGISRSVLSILPARNPDDFMNATWARPLACFAEVPAAYQDTFDAYLKSGRDFPYSVLTPSYEGSIHTTTEKVVMDTLDSLTILEKQADTCTVQRFPLGELSTVESGIMLLHSWITVRGRLEQGEWGSSTFKFNTITDHLFKPILQRARSAAGTPAETAGEAGTESFEHLRRVNYKFMNFSRHCLSTGEKVVDSLYQPEIRKGGQGFLGRLFPRTLSPTLMGILTDRELIMIRENPRQSDRAKYGGVWNYLPLGQVQSLSVESGEEGLLVLTIHLAGDARLEFLYRAEARGELDAFLGSFRSLRENESR